MTLENIEKKSNGSNDYHQYMFVDGKFLGKFEEAYQNCADPWHQEKVIDACPLRNMIIFYCKQLKLNRIADIGCGTGRLSKKIYDATNAKVLGIDVAPTAISKAKARYKGPEFLVSSIIENINILDTFQPDGIVMSHLSWCILPEVKNLIKRLTIKFPQTYLFHQCGFYEKGVQKYGVDYFTNFEEMIKYFEITPIVSTNLVAKHPVLNEKTIDSLFISRF